MCDTVSRILLKTPKAPGQTLKKLMRFPLASAYLTLWGWSGS